VLVHDAARPLLTKELAESVIAALDGIDEPTRRSPPRR
jgi:2-C-methyl-D-erythritol 4-phosphate cytidylyltransferase